MVFKTVLFIVVMICFCGCEDKDLRGDANLELYHSKCLEKLSVLKDDTYGIIAYKGECSEIEYRVLSINVNNSSQSIVGEDDVLELQCISGAGDPPRLIVYFDEHNAAMLKYSKIGDLYKIKLTPNYQLVSALRTTGDRRFLNR